MERPLERRTAARTAVVWDAVRALLDGRRHRASRASSTSAAAPAASRSGSPRWVTGSPSSTPAPTPSPRSPAGPTRRACPTGSPVSRATSATCAELAPEGGVDLVLCHGVLGLVDDPAAALADDRLGAASRRCPLPAGQPAPRRRPRPRDGRPLRPGPRPAPRRASRPPERGERRFTAEEVAAAARRGRVHRDHRSHGVRVFADLVPSSLLDLEPGRARPCSSWSGRWPSAPSTSPSPASCTSSPPADPGLTRPSGPPGGGPVSREPAAGPTTRGTARSCTSTWTPSSPPWRSATGPSSPTSR